MKSSNELSIESSRIVIDKMKFEVVDKHPPIVLETDKKSIKQTLYQIFKKYS